MARLSVDGRGIEQPSHHTGSITANGRHTFALASCATALPKQIQTNSFLSSCLRLPEGWITERCGFVSRPVATTETTGSLAIEAARAALATAPSAPDYVICATFTPDHLLCPTAPAIAYELGLRGVPAFDINGACSGGLMALLLGADLLHAGAARSVLVVASDTTTKFIDAGDAGCRILFGDGAVALVLERDGARTFRVLSRVAGSDGSGAHLFSVPHGGSVDPVHAGTISMNGPALFRVAVHVAAQIVTELCDAAAIGPNEITRVILHQANSRIISAAARLTTIPADRWVVNSATTGNLASASTLHAWASHNRREGAAKPGDKVILAAFGAGLTWAGVLLECQGDNR
jgi:3-oxoacyl-[acyl-carrier-protein] synthase-3